MNLEQIDFSPLSSKELFQMTMKMYKQLLNDKIKLKMSDLLNPSFNTILNIFETVNKHTGFGSEIYK